MIVKDVAGKTFKGNFLKFNTGFSVDKDNDIIVIENDEINANSNVMGYSYNLVDFVDDTDWGYYTNPFVNLYDDAEATVIRSEAYDNFSIFPVTEAGEVISKIYGDNYCYTSDTRKMLETLSGDNLNPDIFYLGSNNRTYVTKYPDFLRIYPYIRTACYIFNVKLDNLVKKDIPFDYYCMNFELVYRISGDLRDYTLVNTSAGLDNVKKLQYNYPYAADGEWHTLSATGILSESGMNKFYIQWGLSSFPTLAYLDVSKVNITVVDLKSMFTS